MSTDNVVPFQEVDPLKHRRAAILEEVLEWPRKDVQKLFDSLHSVLQALHAIETGVICASHGNVHKLSPP